MTYRIGLLAMLASIPALAQPVESFRPELRSFVGAYVPFGAMRSDLKDAPTAGLQGAFEVSSRLHVVGTVGWIYGRHTIAMLRRSEAYLIDYDVGAEFNRLYEVSPAWRAKPFVGVGAGARSYDYGAVGVAATTCATGYGAMGGEL